MQGQAQKRARTDEQWDEDSPKLSKNRACTECKKHKIKCERAPGETKCVRCLRQGHKCEVNSQLQKIIEDDSEWKKSATAQIKQLQSAVADLLRNNALPQLGAYSEPLFPQSSPTGQLPHGPSPTEQVTAMTRENSQDPGTDAELVSAPMGSLFEVTKLRNLRSHLESRPKPSLNAMDDDFISRGLISMEEAERLFSQFYKTMNQFLWGGIALVHHNLTSVRRSSSLLSAAILSVAAIHVPGTGELFDICYTEFITLVSSSTLNRYHTLDEIRGLSIGAFWLSDLSWKLSGHAVRIATEMNLHQSLQKVMRGQHEHYEKARLWYLLYVCDHHFSIAYGRPPVIHDSPSITNYKAYLDMPQAGPGDVRLCIQVALFLILTKAYHSFGSDNEEPILEQDFPLLRAYNLDVEAWRLRSQPISADSEWVGAYPSKGVVLYYHFAKFQLNSLALRAIPSNAALSLDRRECANVAISSAMAILNTILYEPSIRNSIVGIPLFTHTMVAFSSVFLMKIAWKWKAASFNIDTDQVQDLVRQIIDLLANATASDKHLTYHIASGLEKMLRRIKQGGTASGGGRGAGNGTVQAAGGSGGGNGGLQSDGGELAYDTLDVYGFEFDETWSVFGGLDGGFPGAG